MVRICIFIYILSLLIIDLANGQTLDSIGTTDIITIIEEPPLFNGDLKKFIQSELNYPLSAIKDTIEGMVVISFLIDKTGLTRNHNIIKGIRNDLDDEALRVTKLIKFATPALQKGKPIKVNYVVPVEFNLKCNTTFK